MSQREAIEGYLYISPWILGFLIFTFGPMLASLYLSFTDYSVLTPPRFFGIENYKRMFTERLFWRSVTNTLYYAGIFVPLSALASLCCALLLNQAVRGRAFFRALFFLPSITPLVASVILWIWIFHPYVGLMNHLLSFVGISPGPGWLGSSKWSKPALIIISLWGSAGGGNMLVLLAGLQGVPLELHEAAELDGASSWQRFWRITLPLLSPALFFNLVLGIIGALQVFALAYVATTGYDVPAGGPATSTLFYMVNLYNYAFDYWEMGYGSALAWVFFLVVLILTYGQMRLARSWVYYEAAAGEMKW
jgi:multiple sugar transport system permease protein